MGYAIGRVTLLFLAVSLCLIIALIASACDGESEKVVFMAGFKPQANLPFVAVYVAQEKGYFHDQGLEIDILHSNTGEHLPLLMSGDIDITTAAATSVLKRRSDPKLPIVAFALFGQRGQQTYMALSDSGIKTVKQWEGKTVGYKVSVPPDYLAMLRANDVDRSKIVEVNAGFDPRVLTERKVDILAVFKSNEPNIVRGLGFDVFLWDPADYGVPNMGLTYITRAEMIEQDPEILKRFLKATLKGVEYVLDHPEETLDIVMKYASSEQREHQRFMLDMELADAVSPITEQNGLGWMTEAQWRLLYEHLVEFEALSHPFDYRTAYTDRFLEVVYDDGELIWP